MYSIRCSSIRSVAFAGFYSTAAPKLSNFVEEIVRLVEKKAVWLAGEFFTLLLFGNQKEKNKLSSQ